MVEDAPLIALELHNAVHIAGASVLAASNIKELELVGYARACAAHPPRAPRRPWLLQPLRRPHETIDPVHVVDGILKGGPALGGATRTAISEPAPSSTMVDTIVQLLPSIE
jgi:hypothetical protein